MRTDTIIFDLGGVLIDWNPRYLYRKIFHTEEEISWFLENICTSQWNEQQDGGRSFAEATSELIQRHPEFEVPIRAWYGRWQETVGGPIQETVDILRTLRDNRKHRLYALTNWSAETFPWARSQYDFLQWFEGIVVSGEEKTMKPRPEFYHILLNRYKVNPANALFIDDNLANVEGARAVGIEAIHFQQPAQLRQFLEERKML